MKRFIRYLHMFIMGLSMHSLSAAETVGIFADSDLTKTTMAGEFEGMLRFAAGDVKQALESRRYVVELRPLRDLTASYPHKKIVIALAGNATVAAVLAAHQGSVPTDLSPQSYALLTTTTGATTYWGARPR